MNTTGTVRVSVICPTYNRSQAIMATIDSVCAQTVEDWELLVISDGSDDDTEDWVRQAAREDLRVHPMRIARTGHPSGPRNAGLATARGEFIAYLDHDDLWRKDHLAVALGLLEAGADLVATGCSYRDAAGADLAPLSPLAAFWHPQLQLMGPMFEPSRVSHRRGLVELVGGWQPGAGLEDWDLWLRMADAGMAFRTVVEPTAVLLTGSGTRRHRMRRPHRLPLVTLDDAKAAHSLLLELRRGCHDQVFRSAGLADMLDWFHQMAATGSLVSPLDWNGDLDAEAERVVMGVDRLFEELVLVPERGRFALARNLLCARADHARRAAALLPAIQPRQLRLLGELATGRPTRRSSPFGGESADARESAAKAVERPRGGAEASRGDAPAPTDTVHPPLGQTLARGS
ncbi:glycosyltransferase [Frankia sp. R82]|uniref:glycosyltransferase family 2 protein n=1 Tax=Frankia sp. R82 TaxID=2950553 RepID=UPI002043CE6B|nr:glycosyltransferase [Frankia sp. R82]MCM3883396.1 glycosyltransferase [Frankia sp. R82]